MAVPTLTRFLEILRLSGLIDEDDLTRFLKEQYGAETPPEETPPQDVCDRLLQAGVLTPWHAEKLLDGKYKGFRLGNYRLRDFLGSGGMSSVYLAEHVHMHQSRAVKVLPRKKNDESSRLKRFYLEARASAQLRHNNIVQVYDIDQSGDDIHYIVMEYVKGRDLAKAVREDGPLPFDVCLSYMIQAADALQHAHENGLVHRDVKPGNFLVDEKGTLKCMDLGLALFASQDDHSLTQEFNEKVLGTADYLSPEQAINSHNVDHRADIYSLGCTIYYCLTGSPPFPEGTLAQRILNHQTKMPEDPRIYRPEIPQAFVDLIWRMIQKRPEDRLQTAAAVGAELKRLQTYGWDAAGVGAAAGAAATGSSAGVRTTPSPSGAGGRSASGARGGSGSSSDIRRNKPPSSIERQAIAARDSAVGGSGPQVASSAASPAANGTPLVTPAASASDAQKALAAIAADHQAKRAAALRGKSSSDSGRQGAASPSDSGGQTASPSGPGQKASRSGAGRRTSPSGSAPGSGQPIPKSAQPAAKTSAPAPKPISSPAVRPTGPAVRPGPSPASSSDATRAAAPAVAASSAAGVRAPARSSSSSGASAAVRAAVPAHPTPTPAATSNATTSPAPTRAFPGRSGKKGISPVVIAVGVLGALALVVVIVLAIVFSGGSESPGSGSGGGSGAPGRTDRRDTSSLDVPVVRSVV